MIAESLSEGLLDPEEHNRLSRALRIRNRVVADVAVPLSEVHAVPVAADGSGPTVRGDPAGTGRHRLLPLPGRRPVGPVHRLRPHQGRAAAGRRPRRGRRPVDGAAAAAGARVDAAARRAVAAAAQQQPPGAGHRRRRQRVGDGGAGGPGRGPRRRRAATGRTVPDVGAGRARLDRPRADAPEPGRRVPAAHRGGRRPARPIRCGTSCSPTTACGRGSCGSGTPVSASCSAARRRERYLDRSGYGRVPAGVTVTREHLLVACRHRAVHRATCCARRRSRPARLNCFGLHEWAMVYRAPTVRHDQVPLRLGAGGHRRGRRVNAVALQPLRRVPVLHRAGHARATPSELDPGRQVAAEQPGCVHASDGLLQVVRTSSVPWSSPSW